MLTEVEPTNYAWGNVDQIIKRWLQERQELILLYCKVDGLKELHADETPLSIRVRALSNTLIDYVSAGHFEIYKHLMQEAEAFEDNYQSTIDRIMPLIQQSTEIALDFNDRYAEAELNDSHRERLADDLNILGLKMVERFDLEDQLIEHLHNCHRDLVA